LSTLHGLILINKPQGFTSHDVVAKVRKILGTREVGHCGTLDPLATGLMVLAVGEGLKLVSVLANGVKGYEGEIQFGVSTDTLDITGNVIETGGIPRSEEDILMAASSLMGVQEFQVPKYSAVKVQGERLHERARSGEDFEPPTRQMQFFDIKPGTYTGERWKFSFSCSKGSFVRSWGQALCKKLEVSGTLATLKRTYSYPYRLDQAITLDQLLQMDQTVGLEAIKNSSSFISLDLALPDWSSLRVYRYDLHLLKNGQISKSLKSKMIRLYQPGETFNGFKVYSENTSNLVALIGLEMGRGFFIKRGFRDT